MRHRIGRIFGILAVVLALTAGTWVGTAVAALPNLTIGSGHSPTSATCTVGVDCQTGALMSPVGPGKVTAFEIWAQNNGSSNISQFYLDAATDMTPYGVTWHKTSGGPAGTCSTSGGVLKCSFGALNAGDAVVVTAAFKTPTNATADGNNCLPSAPYSNPVAGVGPTGQSTYVCVDFQWSTTGYVIGRNNSHGDRFDWYDFVGNNGSNDFSGQFTFCPDPTFASCDSGLLSIVTNKTLNSSKKSWTGVTAPNENAAYNARLQVQNNVGCGGLPLCSSLSILDGQISEVVVADDTTFAGFIHVQLALYHVNANQITGVYHYSATHDPTEYEITTRCPGGPTGTGECFTASNVQMGNALLDVWIHENGKLGGF